MAEQLETEFTFEPGSDPALPDLSDIAGVATVTKPRVQRLEAVYFDTDDLRLMRAGVTLRRRTGGDDAGWHLKVPTADDTGLPPTDEKNEPCEENCSAISRLVTTNPMGCPLPAALAMVTTSGTTPCISNPQK